MAAAGTAEDAITGVGGVEGVCGCAVEVAESRSVNVVVSPGYAEGLEVSINGFVTVRVGQEGSRIHVSLAASVLEG